MNVRGRKRSLQVDQRNETLIKIILHLLFLKNYRKIRVRSAVEQWLVNVEKSMFDMLTK